jgi:hypothetical protein
MPKVADYVIITDGDTTLNAGSSKDITFNLDAPDAGSRSVIMFNVKIDDPGQTLSFSLNGSLQGTYPFGSGIMRAIHEVVSANLLKPLNNKLTLSSPGVGPGTAHITDIVLMYQHTV